MKKTLRTVMTFYTTTAALALERRCVADGVPGRLIPVPAVITADCGMCWSAPAAERSAVLTAAAAEGIQWQGVYEMLL